MINSAKSPSSRRSGSSIVAISGSIMGGKPARKRTPAAVPEGGFATLEKRLEVARQALEEAWKLEPDDARTAGSLLEIDKAVGGDRATMELWFERAMKADGDGRDACWSKLDWLDPKWHGTPEDMLAFGRRCRDTRNWWAGITLLCADAHTRYANFLGNRKADYLASPEVWSDITSVYDEYLKYHPQDHVAQEQIRLARLRFPALPAGARSLPETREQPHELDRVSRLPARNAQVVSGLFREGCRQGQSRPAVNRPLEEDRFAIAYAATIYLTAKPKACLESMCQ